MNHPTGIFNNTEIIDCGFGESGEAKTPHLFVIFKTEHQEITGYFWMTEKAAKYTQEKLLNMGVPADMAWENVVAGIEDGTLLIGRKVQIVVDNDTYNGETRAQVKTVRSNNYVGGPSRSETAASNAKKFGALWRQTGKSAPVPKVDNPDKGDVPF